MFARSKNQLFSQLLRCSLAPGSGPRAGGWRAKNGSFFSSGFTWAGFWFGTFLTFSENRYWSGLMLTFHWQVCNRFAVHMNNIHSYFYTTTLLILMGNLCDQSLYDQNLESPTFTSVIILLVIADLYPVLIAVCGTFMCERGCHTRSPVMVIRNISWQNVHPNATSTQHF